MSETFGAFERRVRALCNDTRGDVLVSPDRIRELAHKHMHAIGQRIGLGTGFLTSITLSAGDGSVSTSGDYTLSSAVEYGQIQFMVLSSVNDVLTKLDVEKQQEFYSGNPAPVGIPETFAMWEKSDQTVTVRFRPIPDKADTVQVFGSSLPARLSGADSVIPFSAPLLSALASIVAADCIIGMPPEDLAKAHLDSAVARVYRADGEAAIVGEELRRNRLKRTGRIIPMDM